MTSEPIATDAQFERAMALIREVADHAQAARDGNAELQQATNDLTTSAAAPVDLPHLDDKEQQ